VLEVSLENSLSFRTMVDLNVDTIEAVDFRELLMGQVQGGEEEVICHVRDFTGKKPSLRKRSPIFSSQ